MNLTITDRLTQRTALEGAAVPFAVKVYTDTTEPWVLVVPTTLRYRLDDPETGAELLAWTTVSPASSATITITAAQNAYTDCEPRARRRLTVQADNGLATACVATRDYFVGNGFPL